MAVVMFWYEALWKACVHILYCVCTHDLFWGPAICFYLLLLFCWRSLKTKDLLSAFLNMFCSFLLACFVSFCEESKIQGKRE